MLPKEEAAHVVSDDTNPVAFRITNNTSYYHVFSYLIIGGRQMEHLIQQLKVWYVIQSVRRYCEKSQNGSIYEQNDQVKEVRLVHVVIFYRPVSTVPVLNRYAAAPG